MANQAKYRRSHALALITAPLIGLASVSLAHSTTVRTDDSDLQFVLFPSDRYTVPDPNQLTGIRVALPKPDCSVHVSDCQDVDVVNQLDGFNVQPRIVIPIGGAIDLATDWTDDVGSDASQSMNDRVRPTGVVAVSAKQTVKCEEAVVQ